MKTLLIILVMQMPSVAPGNSDDMGQMVTNCKYMTLENQPGMIGCTYYLRGFIDMHLLWTELSDQQVFCLPDDFILNDAREAFLEWTSTRADLAPLGARIGVFMALREAFPCD